MMMTTATTYRSLALETTLVERVRATLHDDDGNALEPWTSDAHGNPCRHCLKLTVPGERLLLFSLRPFDAPGPYAERGPVFVHAEPCARFAERDGLPAAFVERPLTLRAYGAGPRGGLSILAAEVSAPHAHDATLARLFADPHVAFVHARNPAWGCYDFRIERGEAR